MTDVHQRSKNGPLFVLFVLLGWLLFFDLFLWLFVMLAMCRASPILYPHWLLHPRFSLLGVWKWTCAIVMTRRVELLSSNVIFMIFRQNSVQTLSRRLVGFHDACMLYLVRLQLTRHYCFHWEVPTFQCVVDGFFWTPLSSGSIK